MFIYAQATLIPRCLFLKTSKICSKPSESNLLHHRQFGFDGHHHDRDELATIALVLSIAKARRCTFCKTAAKAAYLATSHDKVDILIDQIGILLIQNLSADNGPQFQTQAATAFT